MNWKQKIEAQIAALWEIVPERADGRGFYDDLHGPQANDIDNARQTMQALLDAMTDVVGWRERDWPEGFDRYTAELIAECALDKLRGDNCPDCGGTLQPHERGCPNRGVR